MMEANVEGRKTETRRVIKNLPDGVDFIGLNEDGLFSVMVPCFEYACWGNIKCRYGAKGDIIYSRETIWSHPDSGPIFYTKPDPPIEGIKCTPSIHMPKSASRFFAEITEVRAERLLDISEESAIAEGINILEKDFGEFKGVYCRNYMAQLEESYVVFDRGMTPRESYFSLWQLINGKDSHLLNPWVWVIKYKEIPNPNFQINGHLQN
jgi:hypothetical protein